MNFYSVTEHTYSKEELQAEYRQARAFGVVRVGETALFFRARLRNYYIPYSDIRRCFRRVQMVPAKLCCGKGEFHLENLVVQGEAGELAQIQLPGTRAARALMEELKARIPGAAFAPEAQPDAETA